MNRATARTGGAARKRAYDASGRRAAARETTSRIVAAATELVKEGVRPEEISYVEVAARADVAKRTVYRHFPETSQLVEAIAAATLARFTNGQLARDRGELVDQLARFHELLSADPQLFRVFVATPLRSQIDYGGFLKAMFADVLEGVPPDHRDATAATLEMLGNPYAWEVLHTYWQVPAEQITRTCLAAMQAVADRFRREPELLDPTAPLPPLFRPAPAKRKIGKRKEEKRHERSHRRRSDRHDRRRARRPAERPASPRDRDP